MDDIRLISHGNGYGYATFISKNKTHAYQGIDGPELNRIIRLTNPTRWKRLKQPKQNIVRVADTWKALNIAKFNADEYMVDGKWQPNKYKKPIEPKEEANAEIKKG